MSLNHRITHQLETTTMQADENMNDPRQDRRIEIVEKQLSSTCGMMSSVETRLWTLLTRLRGEAPVVGEETKVNAEMGGIFGQMEESLLTLRDTHGRMCEAMSEIETLL